MHGRMPAVRPSQERLSNMLVRLGVWFASSSELKRRFTAYVLSFCMLLHGLPDDVRRLRAMTRNGWR